VLSLVTAPTVEPLTVAEVKAQIRLDETDGEPTPTAPTVALVSSAGNVTSGAHRYRVTFVTADGETEGGTVSASVTTITASAGQVALSAIPLGGSAVTSRKLYRTAADGSTYLLLATIANNTATTYTDNLADGSLGAAAPTTNTTLDPEITTLITTTRQWAEQETERALLTQTWKIYYVGFPSSNAPIVLPKPPLQSVTHVKYYDSDDVLQTWASSNYTVLAPDGPQAPRGQIAPVAGVSWPLLASYATAPRRTNAVEVQFVCGWTTAALVASPIKAAMKLMAAHLWTHREAVTDGPRGAAVSVVPLGIESLISTSQLKVY